jgi:hypothetical protein
MTIDHQDIIKRNFASMGNGKAL